MAFGAACGDGSNRAPPPGASQAGRGGGSGAEAGSSNGAVNGNTGGATGNAGSANGNGTAGGSSRGGRQSAGGNGAGDDDAGGAAAGGDDGTGVGGDDNGGGAHVSGGSSNGGGANGNGGSQSSGGVAQGTSGNGSEQGGGGTNTSGGGPTIVGICSLELSADAGQPLPLSTDSADRFGGITPDEQVIVWTTGDGDTMQLFSAERESVDQPFGAARSIALTAAADRVTLSPDGLRIVFTNADRQGFSVLSRETRGDDFSPSDSLEFSLLNGAERMLAEGESYGDPVLSGSDLAFVYSRFGADRTRTVFMTRRFSRYAPWPDGYELPLAARFEAAADDRFQPTGLTGDEQTLFLWHPSEAIEYLAEFDLGTMSYEDAVALGPLGGALPNADCSRVYYDSASENADLFVAEKR